MSSGMNELKNMHTYGFVCGASVEHWFQGRLKTSNTLAEACSDDMQTFCILPSGFTVPFERSEEASCGP